MASDADIRAFFVEQYGEEAAAKHYDPIHAAYMEIMKVVGDLDLDYKVEWKEHSSP